MKKILSSIVIISVLVVSLSVPAFSMEPETQPNANKWKARYTQIKEKIAERRALNEEKKQEIADFKEAAKEKSALVKAARDENIEVLKSIKATKKELVIIYTYMKENGVTLDASTLEQLVEYGQQIKNIMQELKDSKGLIRNLIKSNKESLRALDYEALDSMYAEIAEIQSWRNDKLNEIDSILSEMLALVQ